MIAHIIDDLFDYDFLVDFERVILDIPIHTTNVANPRSFPNGRVGSHRLFGTDIFTRTSLNKVTVLHKDAEMFFDAFAIIEEEIFKDPIFLKRIDINLQYYGQNGTGHTDGGEDEYTIMLMNNCIWKPEWGGTFQLLNDPDTDNPVVIEEHEYKPGRIVIFPGHVPHRGLAPLHPYVYRYTTVFRTIIEDIDKYF